MSNTDFLKVGADDGIAAIGERLLGSPTAPAAAGVDASPGEARVVDPKTFDQDSVGFCDIMQEQTACFVRSRWGDDRMETVVIERGGKIIGAAVIVVLTVPLVGGGVAIVKWGPLWRRSDGPADPRLLEACLSALWREYVERRGYCLTVMPHSDPDWSSETENILLKLGFHRGASLPSPDRYLVNVALDAEELRKSLDQKWRYNLKKAAKHQFNIEIVGAADGLDRFMALYAQMMERKRFNDTSAVHTLPDILRSDVDTLQPMIVMVRHDGRD